MKFFSSSNNGVRAVIREDHAHLVGMARKSGGDPLKLGIKVFTFTSAKSLEEHPYLRKTHVGSYEDLDWLLTQGSHELVKGCGEWDGYVPFSNGSLNDDLDEGFLTSFSDVREVFGLGVPVPVSETTSNR